MDEINETIEEKQKEMKKLDKKITDLEQEGDEDIIEELKENIKSQKEDVVKKISQIEEELDETL